MLVEHLQIQKKEGSCHNITNYYSTVVQASSMSTKNVSEFARHFHRACKELNIIHYHTYPRILKVNAHIERFNRILSGDFISINRMLLATDIDAFNEKLVDWLLWYSGERPHQSLGMLSPLQYMVREMNLSAEECQMWLVGTRS